MTTSNTARRQLETERRQKVNQAATAASDADRRRSLSRRLAVGTAIAVVVAAIVALGAFTGKDPRSSGHDLAAMNDHKAHDAAAADAGRGLPPWQAPSGAADLARKAGLEPAAMEGTAEHYHATMQIIVNGQQVPLAPGIGVDNDAQLMSPLHVHEGDGTIHVESPDVGRTFTLGQLFIEWDVSLSATQLGGLHTDADHPLTLTVNGEAVDGNPANLVLADGQKIELRYGA